MVTFKQSIPRQVGQSALILSVALLSMYGNYSFGADWIKTATAICHSNQKVP